MWGLSFMLVILNIVYGRSIGTDEDFRSNGCPSKCKCTGDWINTRHRLSEGMFRDPNDLSNEINELLRNTTMTSLTHLTITNSPLTDVPKSVCNLTLLTELYLDDNKLTRLPGDCLSRMTNLANLSAVDNYITKLQDGLFNGLRKLQYIYLQRNKIAEIGPRVFFNINNHYIKIVNLSRNDLQTLDAWHFSLAYNRSKPAPPIKLYFDHNNILNSSNYVNWRLNKTTTFYMQLYLRHNNVLHITDILNGWNLATDDFLIMINKSRKPMLQLEFGEIRLIATVKTSSCIRLRKPFVHPDLSEEPV
jgi:hypothetical protein